MEVAGDNNREPPREQTQRSKQFLFIIAIYLLFTMSGNFTIKSAPFNRNLMNILKSQNSSNLPAKTVMGIFATDSYNGQWTPLLNGAMPSVLQNNQGRLTLKLYRYGSSQNSDYSFDFQLNNGLYIDDGTVTLRTFIDPSKWQVSQNGSKFLLTPQQRGENNKTQKIEALYRSEHILKTLEQKIIELEGISLKVEYIEATDEIEVRMDVLSEQISVSLQIIDEESNSFGTVVFAMVIFTVSFTQFSAIMGMLKAIFEGQDNASNYSLLTILTATMWDAALSIVSFVQAFRNEQNLILFILPAFVLLLMFTNLELRLMLLIFQTRFQNTNVRTVICRFNLTTYGGLLLIYPILIFTNLSPLLFLAISLIFLPQIYHNGMQGHRPNINAPYYCRFLLMRFLIILYLKVFPWNIFELSPDYLLACACGALVGLQLLLVWMQNRYGPKKILPKFLLPPVFNYGCDIDLNVEEGAEQGQAQCSICLLPLHADTSNVLPYSIPYRLMRAPCNHCFHGVCLVKWMQIKMECPECRGKLPPFE